ncbi:lytic transglycosylase domain-containing protein [Bosea sp. (in: a-proteobacteria)]|uniref:lytic transglycosylase domain-containing protein n=1 Tax=Bosea sp. (in: a-proteobacteria) TaxID=1871050 RepID=UPI002619D904|nr:lytic transglycosylase domain-containing protein [Bosea sp. (in: a-proteobacteria)]MCO5092813.1 lytic transglycosylase domain-containing protein [Bosea sp. (in: a-proteobacteria)]
MASPATARLIGLLLPALLGVSPARADEDGPPASPPALVMPVDVETTGALPPYPTDALKAETAADPQAVKAAVSAYRRGALSAGDDLAQRIDDRAARSLLEWVAIYANAGSVPFARIEAFLREHPNHPATTRFRRRAEEALIAEKKSPAVVRAFFQGHEPLSPAGRIALSLALRDEGRSEEAIALIRRTWRQDAFGQALEKIVLKAFESALIRDDHRLRAERFLFRGNGESALRNAARVSADYLVLARARLASAKARRPIAEKLIAAVPASVRGDVSFAFLQAQQARRADRLDDAVKALSPVPRDPALLGDGDGWWEERRLIARKLLDANEPQKAYEVAAGHGAEDAAERIEAEWHAGFIALRFLKKADVALKHFDTAASIAATPISVARAAYWQGRAHEELGEAEEARAAFGRAAEHPVAYYGQLARAKLSLPGLKLRRTAAAGLDTLPGHKALRLLYHIGERDLATLMLNELAQRLHSTEALEAIAAIARRESDARALLRIGKAALQRGFPLDMAAYPTDGVPEFDVLGDPMERAIVHAIARQESAFDPTAMSHAGARGLMQMMPATARETARRAGLPFDWQKLGQDALYAARMGAAHLNDLLKEWRGSYILTFAAYNAGSPNVKKWIAAYGDPRDQQVDAVDWVERIPFSETRNYVQRVMENLQVYRERLNQRTAYLIDYDLKRGGRRE